MAVGAFHCCQATTVVCCCPWPRSLGQPAAIFTCSSLPVSSTSPVITAHAVAAFCSHHTMNAPTPSSPAPSREPFALDQRPEQGRVQGPKQAESTLALAELAVSFHALSVCRSATVFGTQREQPDEQHAHPPTLLAPLVLSAALLCGRACFLAFERVGTGDGGVEKRQRARGRLRLIA